MILRNIAGNGGCKLGIDCNDLTHYTFNHVNLSDSSYAMKNPSCSVIIVTYNSQLHLPKAMECLGQQTHLPNEIVIVDTGSKNHDYLLPYKRYPNVKVVIAEKESGFCKGNNIGMAHVSPTSDYVFLLNPDAFITKGYLEEAMAFMEKPEQAKCGALTGSTLGYDIAANTPTGKYDTTGIFKTWYGRWYDRFQGRPFPSALFFKHEKVPAICGAVFFCRKKALDEVLLRGNEILDNTFYMYKEDIDLSLRLRNKGWSLFFLPTLVAYHCRGWNADRSKMPRKMRLCSARNEFRIHVRSLSLVGIIYSGLKYFSVKFLDL